MVTLDRYYENYFARPEGLSKLMKPSDVCIVDRGFREVFDSLKDRGYTVCMQSVTEEANDLRVFCN